MFRFTSQVQPRVTLISVVIPAYRAESFIRETLESVLRQTWRPLEVLVVDDASDDGTVAVVESVIAENATHDVVVRLVRHESNRGAASALNTGIEASRGDYVAWLSADDVYVDPDKTTRQLRAMRPGTAMVFDWRFLTGKNIAEAEAVSVGWPRLLHDRSQRALSPRANFLSLMYANPINGSSALMRRDVLRQVGGFDFRLGNVDADADLWMRLSVAGWTISGSDAVGIFYRVHSRQTSQDQPAMATGMTLSRVRMLLMLQRWGLLDSLVAETAVLAGAFRHRLHRPFAVPTHVLSMSRAGRRNIWLRAMRADLSRKHLWDEAAAQHAVAEAEELLDTPTMSTFETALGRR